MTTTTVAENSSGAARYFYKEGQAIRGPVTLAAIQDLVAAGTLDPMTRMRVDGVHAWEPVQVYGVEIPEGPKTEPPAPAPAREDPAAAPPATSSKGNVLWPIAAAIAFGVWWFWPTGFSDSEIERLKGTIRAEYARKADVQDVGEVTLLRKDARELVGFVKVTWKGLPGPQTVDCSATMASDGQNFIWRCGR